MSTHPDTPASIASPAGGVELLLSRIEPVATERLTLAGAPGRLLAEHVRTDRDSPACDVSAMDGYALRLADATLGSLPISAEARIGNPPVQLAAGTAVRIVTGAPVPPEADAVVKREDVTEHADRIDIPADVASRLRAGESIRRRGENAPAGRPALAPGISIDAPRASLLASVGVAQPLAFKRVRIEVLVTGDELVGVEDHPEAWRLRDSNGPGLAALFDVLPYVSLGTHRHAADDLDATAAALADAASRADVVFVTGGVSMGHRDFVPPALARLSAQTLFHRIPQRPGRPILAALLPTGVPVLALPGNPVSVLVTARRIGVPVVRRRAGFAQPLDTPARVTVTNPDQKAIKLWWHRPVQLLANNEATLAPNMGSGDIVGVVETDGFVEIPPGASGPGPWEFYPWRA